jgi:hypothetical protein
MANQLRNDQFGMDMEGSGNSYTEVYPDISVQELRVNMRKLSQDIRYLAEIQSMVVPTFVKCVTATYIRYTNL